MSVSLKLIPNSQSLEQFHQFQFQFRLQISESELTPNSNSSLGIGATTLTQWNSMELEGFQGIPMFVLKSVEKRCEPGVTSSIFGLLVTPGWREGNSNMWNPLESPQFRGIGVGVDPPIPRVELELGHSKNQFQRIGIGVWNCELTPILFQ